MKGLHKGQFFVYTLCSEYPLFWVGRLQAYSDRTRLFTHCTPCRKKSPRSATSGASPQQAIPAALGKSPCILAPFFPYRQGEK